MVEVGFTEYRIRLAEFILVVDTRLFHERVYAHPSMFFAPWLLQAVKEEH